MRLLQVTLPDEMVLDLMRQSESQDVPLTTLIVRAVEAFLLMEKPEPTSGEKCCTVEFSYE
jgi:hypothetical protein